MICSRRQGWRPVAAPGAQDAAGECPDAVEAAGRAPGAGGAAAMRRLRGAGSNRIQAPRWAAGTGGGGGGARPDAAAMLWNAAADAMAWGALMRDRA